MASLSLEQLSLLIEPLVAQTDESKLNSVILKRCFEVINQYLNKQNYLLANKWVEITMTLLELPNDTVTIPKTHQSDAQNLYYKLVLICFYIQNRAKELKITEQLLFQRYLDSEIYNNTVYNLQFYVNKLDYDDRIETPVTLPTINIDSNDLEKYRSINPSIIKTKNGYTVIARGVNWNQTHANSYISLSTDGKIRTRNYLVHLNKQFQLISQHEIVDKSVRTRYDYHVLGLEDCHLFTVGSQLYFTCTTLDSRNTAVRPQISLCKLPSNPTIKGEYDVTDVIPLDCEYNNIPEKNWLPFVNNNNEIHFVYYYEPMTIKKWKPTETNRGNVIVTKRTKCEYNLSRFRGSAGPLPYRYQNNSGYLIVVHEISPISLKSNERGRIYWHRFVWVDINFNPKRASHVWYFNHIGVEFCRSICHSHDENKILLGMGIEDKSSWIYTMSSSKIDEYLSYHELK
jgi:hypothetical protein